MKYDAIVVASGKGKRAGLGFNKVLFTMKNGKTVLENSCQLFIEDRDCETIIVVTKEPVNFTSSKIKVVSGGLHRYDSVYKGLLIAKSDVVFIHDGVRPFLSKIDLEKLKETIKRCDGAILAHKAIETVKCVRNGIIKNTIDRENVYCAMTPQAFKTKVIKQAYETVDLKNITDDASVAEKFGCKVRIVEGNKNNIKLTNKEDFENI